MHNGPQTPFQSPLHSALLQLAEANNPTEMQSLATSDNKTVATDARLVLKIHKDAGSQKTATTSQLATLREENQQLQAENRKLQETLDKLSRLHLDLDRRSP
jgi:aminopeptidase N